MVILEYMSAELFGQVAESASTLLGPGVKSRAERRVLAARIRPMLRV